MLAYLAEHTLARSTALAPPVAGAKDKSEGPPSEALELPCRMGRDAADPLLIVLGVVNLD